jgi:transcriptional regulator with XRE-family HTH domain
MMNGILASGEKIRAARLRIRISQNELAVRCGVQRETVSAWEKPGARLIQFENFNRLVEKLGVKPEEIEAPRNAGRPGKKSPSKTKRGVTI